MKLKLLAVALVAVFVGHWRAFQPLQHKAGVDDVPGIIAGYHATPNFWAGLASWCSGTWINEAAPGALRPVAASWHYLQAATIEAGYPHVVTVATLILFAAVCALAGLLARRWTKSDTAGFVAAVLCAALPSNPQFIPNDLFAWWPVDDNILSLIFGLSSLLLFDSWLSTARRRYAVGAIACVVLSALSKEWGYILPMMLLVMAVYHEKSATLARLRPVAVAFGVVVALVAYRRYILPDSRDMLALNWWMVNGLRPAYWQDGILNTLMVATGEWKWIAVSSLPGLTVLAIYPLSRARLPKSATAAALLCALSLVPVSGSEIFNHRLLFPWAFGAVALMPVAMTLKQWLAILTTSRQTNAEPLSHPPHPAR